MEVAWKKRSNVGQVASMRASLNKLKVVTNLHSKAQGPFDYETAAGRASTSCLNYS
jgi:hypothetical protein